jgi:hypothetical protein
VDSIKTLQQAERWWLTLKILATWEAEVRKIMVQGQSREIVPETSSPK